MRVRTGSLPSGYRRVDYLESTGTQYIKTGVNVSTEIGYSLSFQASSTTYSSGADNIMLGARDSSQRFWADFDNSSTNHSILFGYGNYFHVKDQVSDNLGVFVIETNVGGNGAGKCQLYQDGTEIAHYDTTGQSIASNTREIYMFAANDAGTAKFLSKVRIHGCSMFRNGAKIRDFVPCKSPDGALGMYDVIGKSFYANQGTGAFSYGREIPESFRIENGYRIRTTLLSPAYKQAQYIASSNGSQYIDLPYIPNYSDGFAIDIGFYPTATGKRYCLLSNYNQGSAQLSLELAADNKARFWINNGACDRKSSNTFNVNALNKVRYVFESNRWTIVLNDAVVSDSYTCTSASTVGMRLFLDKAGRTSTFSTPLRIYYCIISVHGTVVCRLVPCHRVSDNVVGMYDTIGKTFYPNVGSGAFSEGPDETTRI